MKALILILALFSGIPTLTHTVDSDLNQQMTGIWVLAEHGNTNMTFKRVKRFTKNTGGYQFLEDGKLVRRQNAGWCGTPPISYSNYDGNWSVEDNGNIHLSYDFWGGTTLEEWKIESIDDQEMVILSLKYESLRGQDEVEQYNQNKKKVLDEQ